MKLTSIKKLIIALLIMLLPASSYAGWQVMSPVPTTNQLRAVWGSSSNDVFAVGDYGTILHYNGNSWEETTVGSSNIFGVWGTSGSNVYAAVDKGVILHYDGNTWENVSSSTTNRLRDVWGTSANNIYIVGENGTILHYAGSVWNTMSPPPNTPTLQTVWGLAENDVFAVGGPSGTGGVGNGTVIHYDGGVWNTVNIGAIDRLHDVWGPVADNIFIVGESGTILHYNGNIWTPMESGTTVILRKLWGTSASDVFAVGDYSTILHYDGKTWSSMPNNTSVKIHGVWGSSAKDVFAVGELGTILHYDGSDNGGNNGCVLTQILGEGNPHLDTLRLFRDNVLAKNKTGQKIIVLYYKYENYLTMLMQGQPYIKETARKAIESLMPVIEKMISKP